MMRSATFEDSHSLPLVNDLTIYGRPFSKIGSGTYSTVYKFQTPSTNYAIKEMLPNNMLAVERELASLLRLHHPNIITPIDVVHTGSGVNLVLPLGVDLATALDHRQLSLVTKKRYIYQLFHAVAYCHSRDLLHRDLKPKNILIFPEGIKLIDFGLARAFCSVYDKKLTTETFTVPYRAPELILGGAYGAPAEVWALGCIMFEMFGRHNRTFFYGVDEDAVLDKIISVLGTPSFELCDLPLYQEYALSRAERPIVASLLTYCLESAGIKDPVTAMIQRMIVYDPAKRVTLPELLAHEWFNDVKMSEIPRLSSLETLHLREQYPSFSPASVLCTNLPLRQVMYAWLYTIADEFSSYDAYFFAVYLCDCTLLRLSPFKNEWYTIGAASYLIASVLYDRHPIGATYIASESREMVDAAAVKTTRAVILRTVGYDLLISTSYHFLIEMSRGVSGQVKTMARLFLMLFSVTDIAMKHLPSKLARVAVTIGEAYYCRDKSISPDAIADMAELCLSLEAAIDVGEVKEIFESDIGESLSEVIRSVLSFGV